MNCHREELDLDWNPNIIGNYELCAAKSIPTCGIPGFSSCKMFRHGVPFPSFKDIMGPYNLPKTRKPASSLTRHSGE